MEGPASPAPAPRALPYYVAFSQLLGLIVVATTGAWLGMYRGGIAWESALQFNVHPLCMIIGLIFLQGDALLVYRVFRNEAKRTTKVLHGLLHVFAFVIALVGLVAVFEHHRKKGYADLYSLHSWFGILAFALFAVQDQVQHVRARGRPGQRAGPAAGRLRHGGTVHPDPRRLEAAPPGGRASALHGLQDADGGRQPQLPVTGAPSRPLLFRGPGQASVPQPPLRVPAGLGAAEVGAWGAVLPERRFLGFRPPPLSTPRCCCRCVSPEHASPAPIATRLPSRDGAALGKESSPAPPSRPQRS
uniref:Transmembrane ascorbate-dependent reductase CYB561 n=1 Tax=Moschus moschiferus TaxID=68415 RepID=A0A8C6G053_MOSMO